MTITQSQKGYLAPLYLLPFDHRHSYVTGDIFKFKTPLSQDEEDVISDSKRVIYEGLQTAIAEGVSVLHAGILVDEEFGAAILRDASAAGIITALPTEKSGSDEFEFEYGDDFAKHIDEFMPTFVKVLVRYNVEDDAAMNERQNARLLKVSDYCKTAGRLFMFELLVPATDAQLKTLNGDKDSYDRTMRAGLMVKAITTLQDYGVDPDVWKVEGLDRREDCEWIVATARRNGRDDVACIVLGRGADEQRVKSWLTTAATVPGFIGFAVGRTSFEDAIRGYEDKSKTREEASSMIAARYEEWVSIFENARASRDA